MLGDVPRRSPLHHRAGHLLARRGALAANLGALLHQLVAIGEALAVVGARSANLRALLADACRVVGRPGHEAHGGAADLPAVVQQALMIGGGVLTAQVQAMVGRLGADAGALAADLDTGEHLGGRHFVWHEHAPFWKG